TVQAIDASPEAVAATTAKVQNAGLSSSIQVQVDNLLSLSFAEAMFPYVLCWGVLMHIVELETALGELARVLAPGGVLVLGENNMHALQSRVGRGLRRILHAKGESKEPPAGIEFWLPTSAGLLLLRELNTQWLRSHCQNYKLRVQHQVARQFTELYTKV